MDGALPDATSIRIDHGGGSEEYRLGAAGHNEILLCQVAYPDAQASGATELACDLWTQSATDVTVTAPGYPPLARTLAVEVKDGCIHTLNVELLLDPGDGGKN